MGSLDAARAYVSLARVEELKKAMITFLREIEQQAWLANTPRDGDDSKRSASTLCLIFRLLRTLLTRAFLDLFHRDLFVLPRWWGSNRFDVLNPCVVYRPAKNEHDGPNTASAFVMSALHRDVEDYLCLRGQDVTEKSDTKNGCRNTANSRRNHMRYRRCDLDR